MNKIILIGMGIICLLVLGGCTLSDTFDCSTDCPCPTKECPKCPECPVIETLNPVSIMPGGHYDYDKERYTEVEAYIYNYGNTQINDLVIECFIVDFHKAIRSNTTKSIGNLAGNNVDKIMVSLNHTVRYDDEVLCRVVSCNNCDILWKHIPDIVGLFDTIVTNSTMYEGEYKSYYGRDSYCYDNIRGVW